jgi:superfamily II DNA or RNA helicase
VNESTLKITDLEYDDAKFISEQFSFYVDNYRFTPQYKMGKWDGRIKLYNMFNSTIPAGCLDKLCKVLSNAGIDYTLEGIDIVQFDLDRDNVQSFLKDELKCKLDFFDHQYDAFVGLLKENRGIGVLPTGSGKSLFQYAIINYLLNKGYAEKVLLVVPSISLVNQMEFDFLEYASELPNYQDKLHKVYGGQDKNTDKPITISTWQSLQELNQEWFEQFDVLMVDECHTCTAKVLSKIVTYCTNTPFRYGVSGTLSESKVNEMQLEALFGKITHFTTTKELTDKGILSPIKIYNIVAKYDNDVKKKFNATLKSIRDKQKAKKEGVGAKLYQAENEFLQELKVRKRFILKTINKCKGNTLVLFRNVEYGKELCELATKYLDRNVYLVYGDVKPNERERIRQIMEEEDDAIIFATLQIFSTGINIKKLKYLIFSQNIKSKIKVIQSIGRTLRKHKTKKSAVLIDIIDNINGKNYSVKHAMDKLELYDEEGHEYKIKEVNL